jgi:hypothetical protein
MIPFFGSANLYNLAHNRKKVQNFPASSKSLATPSWKFSEKTKILGCVPSGPGCTGLRCRSGLARNRKAGFATLPIPHRNPEVYKNLKGIFRASVAKCLSGRKGPQACREAAPKPCSTRPRPGKNASIKSLISLGRGQAIISLLPPDKDRNKNTKNPFNFTVVL